MARTPKAHPNAALIEAAQAALPLARDADEKGAAPIIITAGASSATLRPTKARIEKHIKLLQKQVHKPALRDRSFGMFPEFRPGMSTKEYVLLYAGSQTGLRNEGFFAPLNAEPATLYEGGALDFVPVHELIEEEPAAELLPVAEVEPAPEVAELAPVVECELLPVPEVIEIEPEQVEPVEVAEPLPVPEVVEIEPEHIEPAEVAEVVADAVEPAPEPAEEPEQIIIPAESELRKARRSYVPKDIPSQRSACKNGSAEAFTWIYKDRYYVAAFWGASAKPWRGSVWYYKTQEQRRAFIVDLFQRASDHAERKAKARAEKIEKRKAPHGLEVGDILKSSWGYEQTNVDYYQVTRLVGSSMVEVRAIAQESEDTAHMQGVCVPSPDSFVGEPKRYRVSDYGDRDSIKIASYANAYKVQPVATVAGAKIYPSSRWTAYA